MPLGERACAIRRCRTPKPPAPVSALLAASLVWVAFVGLAPLAAASASTPDTPHAVVLSAGARPSSLPAGGGTVTVTGRVRHATSCQLRLLSAQPFPVVYSHDPTGACASGNYLAQVTVGPNTGRTQRVVAFDIVARNSTSASSGWFGVTILGAPSAVVLSAGAEPRALPAGGGTVTVTGRVRHATSCQLRLLSAQPFPVVYSHDPTGACRGGDYSAHVVIGGNPGLTARTVGFALVARNQSSSFAGPFEVTVAPRPPPTTTTVAQLAVDTQSVPAGTAGRPYYAKLSASGGVPPYTWSTPGGGLPRGLGLTRQGVLKGTPTEPGDFPATVVVSDAVSEEATAAFLFVINAGRTATTTTTAAPLAITTASVPGGSVGVPYAFRLRATGGDPPYTWSQDGGGLPPGLALTGGGVIKGTPSRSGSYMAGFDATDSSGSSTTAVFTIDIGGARPPRPPFLQRPRRPPPPRPLASPSRSRSAPAPGAFRPRWTSTTKRRRRLVVTSRTARPVPATYRPGASPGKS